MINKHKKFIKEAEFVPDRIKVMIKFRNEIGAEARWKNADESLKIQTLRKQYAQNYGNNKVNLKTDSWQTDNSSLTPYTKINIALAVLAEQNPKATFKSKVRGNQAISHFHAKLYDWSLNNELFHYKLNRFIYNQAKYGVAFSCTKLRNETKTVRDLVDIDEKGNEKYDEIETKVFRGPWFKVLNNWQVYWDDGSEVFDPWSMKDWCYYEFYTKEEVKAILPDCDITQLSEGGATDNDGKENKRTGLYKLYFYENQAKDLFVIYHNGKVLDAYPIPNENHKLSLNYAIWNLRDSNSIDGIGLVEIIQQDKNLYDKVNNMSVDQLILSIYKTFFYDGTNEEDGVLTLRPGKGQQVLDPSKVKFLEVPGNSAETYKKMEMVKEDIDANTFSKTLGGEAISGKTAYEIEQIKNASARRLYSPLDGLKFALTSDAHNRMDIIQSLATVQEIQTITDPIEVEAIMAIYEDNPELFKVDLERGIVQRKVYEEIPLGLKKDEDDNIVPSKDIQFFPLSPEGVRFDGEVEIDVKSVILPSPELEKKQIVEMSNLVTPMFQMPREVAEKPARMILEVHNQDEKDWFPDSWLRPEEEQPQIDPITGQPIVPENTPEQPPQAPTVVSKDKVGSDTGIVGKMANLFGKASK